MMKFLIYSQFVLLLLSFKCTESIGGHGDCFTFSGFTYNAVDSSKLQGVSVCLTDFMGHFDNPISGVSTISDSIGSFSLDMCPGYKEVKKWNGTETFKFDSCKAVFYKNGYIRDTVVIRNSDTTSLYIQNMYLLYDAKLKAIQ
jgi:hypothetical protein